MSDDLLNRTELVEKIIICCYYGKRDKKNPENLNNIQEKEPVYKLLLGFIVEKRMVLKTNNKVSICIAEKKKQNKRSEGRLRNLIDEFMEVQSISSWEKRAVQTRSVPERTNKIFKSGYLTFALLATFWVVVPKVTDEDTCM